MDGAGQSPDTLRISTSQAVELALEGSPRLASVREEAEGARAMVRQAWAFPNPSLSAEAENLGALEATSGVPGREGIQGTVSVGIPLSLGGLRGARMEVAEAELALSRTRVEREEVEVGVELARAVIQVEEARARLGAATGEEMALLELLRAMDARARDGEVSRGEAARTRLEWTRARARLARAEAAAAVAAAGLSQALNLPVGAPVQVLLPEVCAPPSPGREDPGVAWTSLFVDRLRVQEGDVAVIRRERVPRIVPQVGWRRDSGFSALAVGFGVELPLLDRRGGQVEAARARVRASQEDLRGAQLLWSWERSLWRERARALGTAGEAFDAEWQEALQVTAAAAEAAFREGEGTLEQLLQARRVRLESLEEAAAWEAELRQARTSWYRAEGWMPDDALFCSPLALDGSP